MKLQFDPNQQFQLDAVAAVADLFDGQPRTAGDLSVINTHDANDLFGGTTGPHSGSATGSAVEPTSCVRTPGSSRPETTSRSPTTTAPLEGWDCSTARERRARPARTSRSRWRPAPERPTSICAPSSSFAALRLPEVHHRGAERGDPRRRAEEHRDHARALPRRSTTTCRSSTSSTTPSGSTSCASSRPSNTLQILVINIDAFRKNFTGTEDEQKSNVIYKESDRSPGGARPSSSSRRLGPSSSSTSRRASTAPTSRRRRSRRSTRSARCATRQPTATPTTSSTGSIRSAPSS